jgi:hypothetical protein
MIAAYKFNIADEVSFKSLFGKKCSLSPRERVGMRIFFVKHPHPLRQKAKHLLPKREGGFL